MHTCLAITTTRTQTFLHSHLHQKIPPPHSPAGVLLFLHPLKGKECMYNHQPLTRLLSPFFCFYITHRSDMPTWDLPVCSTRSQQVILPYQIIPNWEVPWSLVHNTGRPLPPLLTSHNLSHPIMFPLPLSLYQRSPCGQARTPERSWESIVHICHLGTNQAHN